MGFMDWIYPQITRIDADLWGSGNERGWVVSCLDCWCCESKLLTTPMDCRGFGNVGSFENTDDSGIFITDIVEASLLKYWIWVNTSKV